VTTLCLVLAGLIALPAARIGGLIGGGSSPAVASAARPSTGTTPTTRAAAGTPTTAPAPPPPATTPTTQPPAKPPTFVTPAAAPSVHFVPTVLLTAAHLRPDGVDVYSDPTAPIATLHLSAQTEFGTPRVLPTIAQRDTWLEVRLPVRPNNAVGWVRSDAVDVGTVADQLVVDLASNQLQWYHDAHLVLQTAVATGSPASPTPPAEYYVTDVIPGGGAYGPSIIALNGHSDTFTDFGGGDARLAIHGTDDPSSIGHPVSHGCVRVPNDLDTRLAGALQPGTLVEVQ
jgi:lipoprotein-anchoring transpeptidase ErfK/SrfK